jgi:hypothetical protein
MWNSVLMNLEIQNFLRHFNLRKRHSTDFGNNSVGRKIGSVGKLEPQVFFRPYHLCVGKPPGVCKILPKHVKSLKGFFSVSKFLKNFLWSPLLSIGYPVWIVILIIPAYDYTSTRREKCMEYLRYDVVQPAKEPHI